MSWKLWEVRLAALDHAKDEIKSHYDTYATQIDTQLVVLALIFPFALNVIQFSDPFVPMTQQQCPDCVEQYHPWLIIVWGSLIGVILVLPFWGILMLIRCKLKLDHWLGMSLSKQQKMRTEFLNMVMGGFAVASDQAVDVCKGDETEDLAMDLVQQTVELQQDLAVMWNEECGPLVIFATYLLCFSAASAMFLTALSVWLFLYNKGETHEIASWYFAVITTVGVCSPAFYLLKQWWVPPPTNLRQQSSKDDLASEWMPLARSGSRGDLLSSPRLRPRSSTSGTSSPIPNTSFGNDASSKLTLLRLAACMRRRCDSEASSTKRNRASTGSTHSSAAVPLIGA